mmetsp:Transcript_13147/g.46008  ORF Transcript_13147/g.46008 Transcript_13147/m.46008 type:complete len:247 (-) Transcript_13147:69-809(-)
MQRDLVFEHAAQLPFVRPRRRHAHDEEQQRDDDDRKSLPRGRMRQHQRHEEHHIQGRGDGDGADARAQREGEDVRHRDQRRHAEPRHLPIPERVAVRAVQVVVDGTQVRHRVDGAHEQEYGGGGAHRPGAHHAAGRQPIPRRQHRDRKHAPHEEREEHPPVLVVLRLGVHRQHDRDAHQQPRGQVDLPPELAPEHRREERLIFSIAEGQLPWVCLQRRLRHLRGQVHGVRAGQHGSGGGGGSTGNL